MKKDWHRSLSISIPSPRVIKNGVIAFISASLIGVVDEIIQVIMPYSVFDLQDIIVIMLISLMAIGEAVIIPTLSKKVRDYIRAFISA